MRTTALALTGLLSILAFSSEKVNALPLMSESAGKYRYGTLTIHPDHQDPNKFYYFPNSTRFSRDQNGLPLFNFVFWGISEGSANSEKGGYLSMSTHLDLDEPTKAAVEAFMKEHPRADLSVLPVKRSTIGLQTTKKDANGNPVQPLANLFSEFNFAAHGGRAEDEIGINATLTETGARAFRALLLNAGGGQPIKWDYCYVVDGLGPNMDAKIHVNMRRFYEYFEANSSGGYWWFSYSIRRVVEKLKSEGAVRIEMNGGDAKEWEYLNSIADAITKRLFVPELSASPSIGNASDSYPFRFNVGSVQKTELKEEVWTWVRRDLVEREYCTAVNIKDLAPYKNQLIVDADKN